MPRRFVFVDAIPTGSTGKVPRTDARPAARAGVGRDVLPDRPLVEPRDTVERQVAAMFTELLGLDEPVSIDDDFLELGADSLHLQELLADIERDFGRRLPATVLLSAPTVERTGR